MNTEPKNVDAVVVGAGFAGIYMLYKLRQLGLHAIVIEAADDIGGTWYWNRYPGARCDIESLEYSYQFSEELQQEWEWSERYATQPEILRYLKHVVDRFQLRDGIMFKTRVNNADYDQGRDHWQVRTDTGAAFVARYLILATGCLSCPNEPDIPGIKDFAGEKLFTANWPHDPVDFNGKRVGLIGTGSSGVQVMPHLAKSAAQLTVFQRTASYVVMAGNQPLDPAVQRRVKSNYRQFRDFNSQQLTGADFDFSTELAVAASPEERQRTFEARWQKGGSGFFGAYADLVVSQQANDYAAQFLRDKIRTLVKNPEVAAALCPKHAIGCKRLCLEDSYYQSFNQDNVALVDIKKNPIQQVTAHGIQVDGRDIPLDTLVFATGFDAMTGAITRIDIRGLDQLSIRDKWRESPKAYLGLMIAGFPNMFIITGPGSPSVFTNMVPSIEQHVNYIGDIISYAAQHDYRRIDAEAQAEDDWVAHVADIVKPTLLLGCNSWYLGANIPGKPRVFMPYLGYPAYVAECHEIAAQGYRGISFS
ncbi:MAG: NAD(P)/FAD-dependent oxidoreductase [Pseudomonadales bacterium]|nr:NAD(P)/FAD-dependent oxidoreductase [Pseudomonadales bacterium]